MKYHINPETLKPGRCRAEYQCKYAADSLKPTDYDYPAHYDNKSQAIQASLELIAAKTREDNRYLSRLKKQAKRGIKNYNASEQYETSIVMSVDKDGNTMWKLNSNLHRLDGPAYISKDGESKWYKNGQLTVRMAQRLYIQMVD